MEKRSHLRKKSLYLESINEVSRSMVFEGLARMAQRAFIELQAKGLAKFLRGGVDISDALSLLADYQRLEDQVYLNMALYSTGGVLVAMSAAGIPLEQIYTTDVLDKAIVNNPTAIRVLLRHFITNRGQAVQALNSIRETQITDISVDLMKLALRKGLGKYGQPFILGREYFTLIEQIDKEIDSLTPEQIDARLEEFKKLRPELVGEILQSKKDKKTALKGLEAALGRVRQRFDEEFNKLFEEYK